VDGGDSHSESCQILFKEVSYRYPKLLGILL